MNFNDFLPLTRIVPSVCSAASAFRSGGHRSCAMLLLRGCLLLLLGLVGGCGGGANTAASSTQRQTGRLQVVVKWPAYQPSVSASRSIGSKHTVPSVGRLIPSNATSIAITVQDPTSANNQQTFSVTRQDPAHTFVLPIGTWKVDVTEYDGDSPVTLQAETTITIQADQLTPLSIAPDTNIAQIEVKASPASVIVGQSALITATAYTSDADGKSMVPVANNAFTFDSPSTSVIFSPNTPSNTATITSMSYGDVTVTAHLKLTPESSEFSIPGQTFQTTVHFAPNIVLTPANATLGASTPQVPSTVMITAQINGIGSAVTGPSPTWSVVEPNGGSLLAALDIIITPSSTTYTLMYTAPNTRGTFHVRVTSDTTSADATIQVQSGNLNVNVN